MRNHKVFQFWAPSVLVILAIGSLCYSILAHAAGNLVIITNNTSVKATLQIAEVDGTPVTLPKNTLVPQQGLTWGTNSDNFELIYSFFDPKSPIPVGVCSYIIDTKNNILRETPKQACVGGIISSQVLYTPPTIEGNAGQIQITFTQK